MKVKTTLIPIDGGLALVLPQELVGRLALKAGDAMEAHVLPHGILLTTHTTDQASQLDIAREFMDEYSETFQDLAKR